MGLLEIARKKRQEELEKLKQRRLKEIKLEIDKLLKEKDLLIKKKEVLIKKARKEMSEKHKRTYLNIDKRVNMLNKKLDLHLIKLSKQSFAQIKHHSFGKRELIGEIRGISPIFFSEIIKTKEELKNLHKQRIWIDKQIGSNLGVVESNFDLKVITILNRIGELVNEQSRIVLRR